MFDTFAKTSNATCCWPPMLNATAYAGSLPRWNKISLSEEPWFPQQIATGIWGAELQFDSDCQRQSNILRERILLQLQEATKRVRQEREKYLSLRQDRRAMETLRDSARQQFENEQRRREQLAADEIHLLSRGRAEQNLPSD